MNTSWKMITAIGALALGLRAATAMAGPLDGATTYHWSQAVLAQTGAASGQDTDELLRRARKFMEAGDLKTADALISEAEHRGGSTGFFHTGDNPKRARADLSKLVAAQNSRAPASRALAAGGPKDPFMARGMTGAEAPDTSEAHARAMSFLLNGRQELAKNNLAAASHWYRQAADQPAKFAASEDTPAKLADEIQRRGGKVDVAPATPAASQFAGPNSVSPLPQVDNQQSAPVTLKGGIEYPATASPNAIQVGRAATAIDVREEPAPTAHPVASASYNANYNPAASAETRAQSDQLIVSGRKSLAMGDVKRASSFAEQARQLNANYDLNEDSPAKLEAMIRRYGEVMSNPAPRESESARHQLADILVEQAECLRRWREFDEAERLATDAARQGIVYGMAANTPEKVLQKIAADRRPGGQSNAVDANANQVIPAAPGFAGGKAQAVELTRQARMAMSRNDLSTAQSMAKEAINAAPDSAFGPGEDRPSLVMLDISKARRGQDNVQLAGNFASPIDTTAGGDARFPVQQTVYDRGSDLTHNVQASANVLSAPPVQLVQAQLPPGVTQQGTAPENLPGAAEAVTPARRAEPGTAMRNYQAGLGALRNHKGDEAFSYFKLAWDRQDELDGATKAQLQSFLQNLNAQNVKQRPANDGTLDAVAVQQQTAARQASIDMAKQQAAAMRFKESDPKRALDMLMQAQASLQSVSITPADRDRLSKYVEKDIRDVRVYIEQNRGRIDLESKNTAVRNTVAQERLGKVEVQDKMAVLVETYNKLMEEHRFSEAQVIAKKAQEIDPKDPVVVQLLLESRIACSLAGNAEIREAQEKYFGGALDDVDRAVRGPIGDNPIEWGPIDNWNKLTRSRGRRLADGRSRRSEREIEIEQKLNTPVSLKFHQRPLNEVINYLSKVTDINMHLDQQGLDSEGVTAERLVTIDLTKDITLKSALKLILPPLHLNYVIRDEVLKITSESMRDSNVYTVTYPVADLVIPIPNFVPGPNGMGISAELNNAYNRQRDLGVGRYGPGSIPVTSPIAVAASEKGANTSVAVNPQLLAQRGLQGVPVGGGNGPVSGSPQPVNFGPGGMGGAGPGGLGGGNKADFDTLIQLITSTIQPTTWDDVGGQGSVKGFDTNLSLVVSQTQEVHEEIVDLLQQLRRLQDLQVTIEVRFIRLRDDFFERIGLDFDFNIPAGRGIPDTNGNTPVVNNIVNHLNNVPQSSISVGVQNTGNSSQGLAPTVNGDFQFRQGGAGNALPQFGGFQPSDAATFGFAILSRVEAFFLVQAAQGDTRANILQAPKVTLFNGQQAFVSDTSQRPFVTSVIPVVGDFAAAQQPVIVVLSEGTSLTVQAVVSNDRRFVRLTVVPFFSQIGPVEEFTFQGSRTTTRGTSSAANDAAGSRSTADNQNVTQEGTTVQLPTFQFVTVTTTVSVPDGGTVLLGGIKRLSEGRTERGVPVLDKLPYINRLFKNVGIGRTTESLMMMVTPRIIIQEEEEERAVGSGG